MCGYHDIGDARLAAWSHREAYLEVGRISGPVWFELDVVPVHLDGPQFDPELGQTVIPRGPGGDLTTAAALPARKQL